MPSGELLEAIYESLQTAEQRVFDAELATDDAVSLGQSIRHLAGGVSLLADLVDRELVRKSES